MKKVECRSGSLKWGIGLGGLEDGEGLEEDEPEELEGE